MKDVTIKIRIYYYLYIITYILLPIYYHLELLGCADDINGIKEDLKKLELEDIRTVTEVLEFLSRRSGVQFSDWLILEECAKGTCLCNLL